MKIKVSIENKDKIEAALKAINGKANNFIFSDYFDVERIARYAEHKFECVNIPKYMRKDAVTYAFSGGDKLPRSYKYKRKVTCVRLMRGKTNWFIVNISSVFLYPDESGSLTLLMTYQQKERAIQVFKKSLTKIL